MSNEYKQGNPLIYGDITLKDVDDIIAKEGFDDIEVMYLLPKLEEYKSNKRYHINGKRVTKEEYWAAYNKYNKALIESNGNWVNLNVWELRMKELGINE